VEDPARAGASLENVDGRWLTPRDVGGPLIVLIHGFTASGQYLERFARFFQGHGATPAIFQYDSYTGIDEACRKLLSRLAAVAQPISEVGLVLLGHSMGGLVARLAAVELTAPLRASLRAIVTIGTPNQGTLSHELVGHMLDWAETVSDPHPFARAAACRSSLQLTRTDPEQLIDTLRAREAAERRAPMLSVSGGLAYLETTRRKGARDRMQNVLIQRLLKETPNDGLVAESSADLRRLFPEVGDVHHINDYDDYSTTNHTYLIRNQEVATRVLHWLRAQDVLH
jgi:pimeloyl-ACP methyl ester carboxylesterase